MKRLFTLTIVLLLAQLSLLHAQITTVITPKVQLFPASGLSYLDDPCKYFNVIMTNTTAETQTIYIDVSVSCDFSATGGNFLLRTPNNIAPSMPLTLGANQTKILTMADFNMVMSQVTGNNIVMQGISWQDALLLPEGNYRICIHPYQWTHAGGVTTPVSVGDEGCTNFTICYSGSAPEFTTPIIGQSATNLSVSNPRTDLSGQSTFQDNGNNTYSFENSITNSDNRNSSNYSVLTPERNLKFGWQGIVSNCIVNNNVNYILKVVEVLPTQNVQDAIDHNATILTANVGSKLFYQMDTLKDPSTPLQRGHVYAAQVQAVPKSSEMILKLGNDGKSQIITFSWGELTQDMSGNNSSVTKDSTVTDNKEDVIRDIRNSYFISPVVDDPIADALVALHPEEGGYRPANMLSPIDGTYYQLDDHGDFIVAWMPLRSDSVTCVEYIARLYEYNGGDMTAATLRPALKEKKFTLPDGDFGIDAREYVYLNDKSWKDTLSSGFKYLLTLEAAAHFKYLKTTEIRTTTVNNGIPSTETEVKKTVMSGTQFFYSTEIFQWGIDSSGFDEVKVAQFVFPVDQTDWTADLTNANFKIDEVFVDKGFKFKWSQPKNVSIEDTVTYNFRLAKLGRGKMPSQVRDTLFYISDLRTNEYINDSLIDSLKVGSQFMAYVETVIKMKDHVPSTYIIPNKGRSFYAAFKIVETEELVASLDPKSMCYLEEFKAISTKDTLRPKDLKKDLVGKPLKMNNFKVVFEQVQEKTDTLKVKKNGKQVKVPRKSYYGEGYIVWHPFGVDTRIKVKLDSILFNNDYEIFTGRAITMAADSNSLLPMDFNGKYEEWGESKINSIYKDLSSKEDCQQYIEAIEEKRGSYVTVGGLVGMGDDSGNKFGSPAFYLPLRVNSQDFFLPEEGSNILLSVNNMLFTPQTALMNLFALYYSHEDQVYIPLVATNICMDDSDFLAGADYGFDLYLAKSLDFTLKDGYKMRLKASTKLGKKDDGTYISFGRKEGHKRGGFQQLNIEFEFDIASDQLLAVNNKTGVPQKGTPIKVSAMATIQEWGNWLARVKMDPFVVSDFQMMSFIPGKGLWYDHSSKTNPAGFPKDYKPGGSLPTPPGGGGSASGGNTAQNNTSGGSGSGSGSGGPGGGGQKPSGGEWQGFFMEDLGCAFTDSIKTIFGDADTNAKEMYQYSYGENGVIKDSSAVAFTKDCLGFHIANMIIDNEGFTADFKAVGIVNASTSKGGGWAFSLDTIGVKVLKNEFKEGYMNGTFSAPLLSGRLHYNCVIATDKLTFGIKTGAKDTVGFDLWAAKLELTGSYFEMVHKYKSPEEEEAEAAAKAAEKGETAEATADPNTKKPVKKPQTSIDLKLNGKINIDFGVIGIPVDFAAVKFENMTLRNYEDTADHNVKHVGEDSDLWFFMGNWSKASPQHYMMTQSTKALYSGNIGGFTFTVETLKPVIGMEKGKAKIGVAVSGKVGFKTGGSGGDKEEKDGENDSFSLDAGGGFKFWGLVDYHNWEFDKDDIGGSIDSITIATDCFSVFKLNGSLAWIGNEEKDPTYGEGMFGSLEVTIMDKVTVAMAAGFGSVAKNDTSSYKWWFFEGAASGLDASIPPVKITGLGGGFAYNMTVKKDAMLVNAKPHELISASTTGGLTGKLVTSSLKNCSYIPSEDSWVAKAGVSLALENEKVMNADGILTLRVSEGKFSGILIDLSAYVMSKVSDTDPAKSAKEKNPSPLMVARAVFGYEKTKEMHYFRFSFCVKMELDFTNFLKDSVGNGNNFVNSLTDSIKCFGDNIKTAIPYAYDPTKKDDEKSGDKPTVEGQNTADANAGGNNSSAGGGADGTTGGTADANIADANGKKSDDSSSKLGASAKVQIPVDLEIKHYCDGYVPENGKKTEWYFSIGKPAKAERVTVGFDANLVICKAYANFTFYFITGNSFDYSIPELDQDVHDFFFGEKNGKQVNETTMDKINAQNQELEDKYKNSPKFEKAGGFAMGATFRAGIDVDCFFYLSVKAALGFDVALMDTKGQSCEGYNEIGKNNFYAMGQLYAMLEGSAGISINLGFWKGKLELFSMGVGALLKGGGPRPSWGYGLLRLKASVLNGLISINTSLDFSVGDVCVPGATDPLANVNFFESISPGVGALEKANKTENYASPLSGGVIISNMPWEEEIILCTESTDGRSTKARKFIFVMEKSLCQYEFVENNKLVTHNERMNIRGYDKDNLLQIFSDKEGGFPDKTLNKWSFTARAFEYRVPYVQKGKIIDADTKSYEWQTCTQNQETRQDELAWYDPLYENDEDSLVHIFRQDTVVYFNTNEMPPGLIDQVIYTWPYNGDPSVPYGEVTDIYVYMAKPRSDLFDQTSLLLSRKALKIWITEGYGGQGGCTELTEWTYDGNADNPHIAIHPYGYKFKKNTPYKIELFLVDMEKYQEQADQIYTSQVISTMTDYELTSQNWNQVYASHSASMTTQSSEGSPLLSGAANRHIIEVQMGKINMEIDHEMGKEHVKENHISSSLAGMLGGSRLDFAGSGSSGSGSYDGSGGGRTPKRPGTNSTGGNLTRFGASGGTQFNAGNINLNREDVSVQLVKNTAGVSKVTGSVKVQGKTVVKSAVASNSSSNMMNTETQTPMNMAVSPEGVSFALAGATITPYTLIATQALAEEVQAPTQTRALSSANTRSKAMTSANVASNQMTSSVQPHSLSGAGSTTQTPQTAQTTLTPPTTQTTRIARNTVGGTDTTSSALRQISRQEKTLGGTGTPQTVPSGRRHGLTTTSSGSSVESSRQVVVLGLRKPSSVFENNTLEGVKVSQTKPEIQVTPSFGHSLLTGSTLSEDTVYDVEDYQYEKLKEDYTEQGSDTTMNYKRTSLEEYFIACSLGDTLYTLCFKTDDNFDTYKDLFNGIMQGFGDVIQPSSTPEITSTRVTYPLKKTSLTQAFNWYSYLFCEYKPQDSLRYNRTVTLPPIASFIIDVDKPSHDMAKHKFLWNAFNEMRMAFTQTRPVTKIPKQDNEGTSVIEKLRFNKLPGKYQDITCEYGYEYLNGTRGGLIPDATNQWTGNDYRLSHSFLSNTFFPSYENEVPSIVTLQVSRGDIPTITANSFGDNSALYEDYGSKRSRVSNNDIKLIDCATPAMYNDIKVLFDFFQKCKNYALYICDRGFSYKRDKIKNLYKKENMNLTFQFDNFPFQITQNVLLTHYMDFNYNVYTYYDSYKLNMDDKGFVPTLAHPSSNVYLTHYFYSYYWLHINKTKVKKHEEDGEGFSTTRGIDVDLEKHSDIWMDHWYSDLNKMGNGDNSQLKIRYVSGFGNDGYSTYTKIAKQIREGMNGVPGETIKDKPFYYNRNHTSSYQYKNVYKTQGTGKKISDDTKALDPKSENGDWFN